MGARVHRCGLDAKHGQGIGGQVRRASQVAADLVDGSPPLHLAVLPPHLEQTGVDQPVAGTAHRQQVERGGDAALAAEDHMVRVVRRIRAVGVGADRAVP